MHQHSFSDYVRRYFLLFCGLFIMAFGVALSINANMGISPISCLPYVLNQTNDILTVGEFTAAMHIAFVLLQIILLRRQYAPYQLLQLGVAVILGCLIDFALVVIAFLQPVNYLEQCLLFVLSTGMVGFGMFLEIKAGVLMVAGEGLVMAIATAAKKDFGKVKISLDCSLVVISLIIGLAFANKVIGIREGTVLAAIFVGLSIKYFNKHIQFVDRFLGDSNERVRSNRKKKEHQGLLG